MTEKQKRFCEEYLKDLNATRAAIRAGYSRASARSIGFDNMSKAEIKSYIDEQMRKLSDESVATAKEILQYPTSVMRGESESEIVVLEGIAPGISKPTRVMKKPDEKERLKAAELLGKRWSLFTENLNIEAEPVRVVIGGVDDLED